MLARLTFSPRILTALVVVASAAIFASSAQAQNQREDLETIGRVMGMQGNMLQVEARDGVVWLVQLPTPLRNVTYRNSAGAKFLGPGVFVNFTGKFDKRGKMEGSVSTLKVFTPQSPDQLGVFPDAIGAIGTGLGTAPGQTQPDQPQPGGAVDDGPKSYQVSGRVAKMARNGDMVVQAGQTSVTVPVDPQVEIEIEVDTLELMRPGDTINLEAWYYPQRVGQAMATQVEVTGAQPLGVEPVAGAPAPKGPEKPAFTPGFGPRPTPQPSTILPNTPQPGTPAPGTAPQPSTILPNSPQPGTPQPEASPFDLK
ncbi:MAG TPA: hypothetical protein VGN57_05670 [Pirellulaceae bacterium]|jgi:hypothetical protein|nr:hypothetical protein [Pirellulaceae bacterium]